MGDIQRTQRVSSAEELACAGEAATVRMAGAANDSIVDGPGLRLTIFVQGCLHDCPGCQNPETHDLDGGYVQTVDYLKNAIAGNPLLDGVTLSGGEPMLQPEPLLDIARYCHDRGLNVWCFTGYLYEDILAGKPSAASLDLLKNVDVLVDGPFILDKRSLELRFRGSSNQRIIDVPESLASGEVVLWED